MTMQRGEFYDSPVVGRAVTVFEKRGRGFYDFAFQREDIKQEAALARWLAKDKTSTVVYRRIVDAERKINPAKRTKGKDRLSISSFVEFDEEKHDNAQMPVSFVALEKFVCEVRNNGLEDFIFLFYIDELTRAQIKQRLNITDHQVQTFIRITKQLALKHL